MMPYTLPAPEDYTKDPTVIKWEQTVNSWAAELFPGISWEDLNYNEQCAAKKAAFESLLEKED